MIILRRDARLTFCYNHNTGVQNGGRGLGLSCFDFVYSLLCGNNIGVDGVLVGGDGQSLFPGLQDCISRRM